MNKRRMLTLYGWDATNVQIPLPKNSYWFKKNHQHKCVASCKNYPTIIYVSDYGFATIGYCEAHAARRIMLSLLSGFTERGIWVECLKGKLVPFSGYDVIETMMKVITDKHVLKRLKEKKAKLIQFRKEQRLKPVKNNKANLLVFKSTKTNSKRGLGEVMEKVRK